MEGFFSLIPGATFDVFPFASAAFLRACLNPNTMNKLVRVRSDSAPPCNQSTLDKEVPYFTFAVQNTHKYQIHCPQMGIKLLLNVEKLP